MAEFNLKDLIKIAKSKKIVNLLVEKGIIKEEGFRKQLEYEIELGDLQYEFLRLQEYCIQKRKRLLIIYEGRDAAGKGGTISRAIAKLNPKNFKVMALPKPTENEQKQWYFQRYIHHLPMHGEISFFDRSWYNRAVVEPVFGFCTDEQYTRFMSHVNEFEHLLIEDGIIVIKFFLKITKDEQKRRLDSRAKDPLKQYKIGVLDQQAQEKWDVYSEYIDKMLKNTSTEKSPWIQINTDDKKTARLETLRYIIKRVACFESDLDLSPNEDVVKVFK